MLRRAAFLVAALLAVVCVWIVRDFQQWRGAPLETLQTQTFSINAGSPGSLVLNELAAQMHSPNPTLSRLYLRALVELRDASHRFQVGEYGLSLIHI